LVVPAAAAWLGGCSVPDAVNPVSWYHGLTGASKSDDTADQPNQKNLAQGNKEPYPNLGDVPDVPERALSTVDREKLEKSLIADRENAKYTDQQLEAGKPVPGIAAPPPPAPASPAQSPSAAPTAPPSPSAPPAPQASQSPAKAPAPTLASAAPATPPPAATAAPPAAPAPAPQHATASVPPRGSESPPQESPLVSPTIPGVPQTGDTPVAPPPAPQIPLVQAQAAPAAAPQPARAPAAPPAAPKSRPPAQTAAAAPPRSATTALLQDLRRRQPEISYEVSEIGFASDSAAIAEAQHDNLNDIVKLKQEDGGNVRVIGYAEPAKSGDAVQRETDGLTLALARAQAVAEALTQRGVPADQIAIEAAPVRPGRSEAPRAEIYLER